MIWLGRVYAPRVESRTEHPSYLHGHQVSEIPLRGLSKTAANRILESIRLVMKGNELTHK